MVWQNGPFWSVNTLKRIYTVFRSSSESAGIGWLWSKWRWRPTSISPGITFIFLVMLWLVTTWSWAHICKLLVIGLMFTWQKDDPEVPSYLQSSGLWVLAGLSLYTCSSSGGKSRMKAIISRPIPDVKTHLPMSCVTNPEIGHVEIEMNPCYWCARPCLSMPELITMERNQVALRCGLQGSSSIRVDWFIHQCWSLVQFENI